MAGISSATLLLAGCGGEPFLRAEGPDHALRGCVSAAAGRTVDDPYEMEGGHRAAFFSGASRAQQREGAGFFTGWVSSAEDAPEGRKVDFLFYANAKAAEAGVGAARRSLLQRGEDSPSTAERHGNLVMYYEAPLTGGQRIALDACLKRADADGGGKTVEILTSADREAVAQRRENRFRAIRAQGLKEARDPVLLTSVRMKAALDCLNGTEDKEGLSRTELTVADPDTNDPMVAPGVARAVGKLPAGEVTGFRFAGPKVNGVEREPALPNGWDFVALPDEAIARQFEGPARAEVAKRWPRGSVRRSGPVLTLLARSLPSSSEEILATCLQQGQSAVDEALRQAVESYG